MKLRNAELLLLGLGILSLATVCVFVYLLFSQDWFSTPILSLPLAYWISLGTMLLLVSVTFMIGERHNTDRQLAAMRARSLPVSLLLLGGAVLQLFMGLTGGRAFQLPAALLMFIFSIRVTIRTGTTPKGSERARKT